jgi:hypothetical protein
MARRYGPEVERSIATALAGGMRTADILRGMKAGTLDGLRGPVEIGDRTFYEKLRKVRQRLLVDEASKVPQRPEGWFIERLEEIEGARARAGISDDEEFASHLWTRHEVRDMTADRYIEIWREERDKIPPGPKRGHLVELAILAKHGLRQAA